MSRQSTTAAARPAPQAGEAAHYVRQGELKVCLGEEDWIGTLLGSCVALCLRDPVTGIGGLNHFLLPSSDAGNAGEASTRYGGYAIEMLINTMMRGGADRRRMEGKIFGGGKLFHTDRIGIGEQNIAFVREFCELEEIPIVKADVGGSFARKLLYQPKSGRARVLRLNDKIKQSLGQRDQDYRARLVRTQTSGDAELFT